MAGPAPTVSFRFAGLSPLTALGACAALTTIAPPVWAKAASAAYLVAANDQVTPATMISAAPNRGFEAWDYRVVQVAATVGAQMPAPTVPLDPVFTWR